jgi:hypothetical protein
VLTAPVIGADETWWRLMGGSAPNKRWWAWSVTREDAVAYMICESRSQEAARQVLNGYRGIVAADGYGAYDALARAGPSFTLAHCWAHVRRKFVDAEAHYPAPCAEVLALIGQLYAVERAGPAVEVGTSDARREEALALRARARREQSAPIIVAIHAWAHQQRVLPESSVGKAIAYMLGLWNGLTRFLNDPRIALDNNATERALRVMVSPVSLCPLFGSAWNRESEDVAGIAIRATPTRSPTTERRLNPTALEIGRENLPGSIEHDLPRGQETVPDQPTNHMTGDPERPCGFQHREAPAIFHRRLVPRDARFAPIVSDTALIPGISMPGAQSETVERGRNVRIRPPGRHLADQPPRVRGRLLRMLPRPRLAHAHL